MRVQFQDKIYAFENKLSVTEAMLMHDKAHIGVNELISELIKGNPYVTATLAFILARRNKQAIRWEDLLSENALEIKILGDEVEESSDEPADEPKGDPPASTTGRTRKRGTTST